MELVTGHTGTNHVTSAQARALNAAIFGGKSYVVDYGTKFQTGKVDGPIFRIDTGAVVMKDGGFVVSDDVESILISSTTGSNLRIDIVGILRKVEDGIESASFHVVEGTPAASDPQPPDISGMSMTFMPLYKITVSSVRITETVAMYEVFNEKQEAWTMIWSGTVGQSKTQDVGKSATEYKEFMLDYSDGSRMYSQAINHKNAANPMTSISRVTNDGTTSYIVSMNVSWTGTNLVTGVARQITRTSSSTTQANLSSFQITALYAR